MKCNCCVKQERGLSVVALYNILTPERKIFMKMCRSCLKQFDIRRIYKGCTYCEEPTENKFVIWSEPYDELKVKLCNECENFFHVNTFGRDKYVPEYVYVDSDSD